MHPSLITLVSTQKESRKTGIPIVISYHAGAYISNSVFYAAANLINSFEYATKYGFIHIPLVEKDSREAGKLTISKLVEGILGMLDWL
jgi:pyrrolidone-carboxylate peptidase